MFYQIPVKNVHRNKNAVRVPEFRSMYAPTPKTLVPNASTRHYTILLEQRGKEQ